MQKDICFYCSKPGHWARVCPSKTPEKSSPSSSRGGPTRRCDYPLIHCPCGNGTCRIWVSKTEKNPDRSFYTCPVQGSGKCKFFKWCDEIKTEDTKVPPPKCPCGAGTCRKYVEVKGPNVGRSYFVCPIKTDCDLAVAGSRNRFKTETLLARELILLLPWQLGLLVTGKGLGACPFFDWADSQSSKSKGYGSPQSMCDSHKVFDETNNELQTEQHERMESILSNPQDFPNSEAVPTSSAQAYVLLKENQDSGRTSRILPEKGHDPSLRLTPQNENTVPNSAKGDLVMQEVESWDSTMQKASVDRLMSQYDIHCRQMEFWKQISVAGISTADVIYQSLGLQLVGWLGRLAFPPPRCLKDRPPSPFFCGIFPSYDLIFVPKDRNMHNPEGLTRFPSQSLSRGDDDYLLLPIPGHDLQLWNGDIRKPSGSGLKRSSTAIEDENVRDFVASLISKSLGVLHIQNQLVMFPNLISPSNYDSMKEAARLFLPLLDGMPVDNDAFSGRLKQFIDSVTRLSAIEQSICNEQSLQGCTELYNSEKVHLGHMSKVHERAVSDFTSSSKHLQSLREEASLLRDMLRQIEDKLCCCEAETSELKTLLDKINRDMLESKRRMLKAEEALKVCKQREEEGCAAKAALEKVRIQLQQ
ncbi:hypothetical protein Pint_02498 [Pistacia integerrima]|uniref:Uncharacterized protein n=1 Tax=Pistacia integerrima TaxID=434235 RepID=A0ACC0ZJE3_9ROSI|nr:hypothetical protein Pint_02498 [Pistacia integerrima]